METYIEIKIELSNNCEYKTVLKDTVQSFGIETNVKGRLAGRTIEGCSECNYLLISDVHVEAFINYIAALDKDAVISAKGYFNDTTNSLSQDFEYHYANRELTKVLSDWIDESEEYEEEE